MRKEIIETKHKKTLSLNRHNTNEFFFTVVICTYNRANLLGKALQSLVNQKFRDFEVIVVDDGSTDQTFAVVKEFRNKLNLRYIFQQNKGLSIARNVGGFSANGEFITFLDSDDEYLPQHLMLRYEILMQERTIQFLYGGVQIIGNEYVPDVNNPNSLVHLSECVVGGTFFIKKDLFMKMNGFNQMEYGDDYDFYKRVLQEKVLIKKVDFPTYVYNRNSEDSICNTIINKGKTKNVKEKGPQK